MNSRRFMTDMGLAPPRAAGLPHPQPSTERPAGPWAILNRSELVLRAPGEAWITAIVRGLRNFLIGARRVRSEIEDSLGDSKMGRACPQSPSAARPYSTLMLAARITFAHFSLSSTTSFPKSDGEPGTTVPPRSASRAFTLGSASAALISLLSLSTISAGVFLGAKRPNHPLAS